MAHQVFATTIQKTEKILGDIESELGWKNRQHSYKALRSILQALRDRLPMQEAVDLGSELPMLIRGFYFEGWRPSKVPQKMNKEEFMERLEKEMFFLSKASMEGERNIERIVKSVFKVLNEHISSGEKENIKSTLPKNFNDLFL
jgi:uncharacterized protein (DUF2267 family)